MSSNVILETNDLTKRFGGLTAVDNVNLQVMSNQVRSIIGPNGAGKSTLFNLINGFLTPTEGAIHLAGDSITGLPAYQRCQQGIGRSFQVNDLFESLTVRENVRIGAQAKHEKRLNPIQKAAEIDEINETTEQVLTRVDLDTVADVQANELSYGNQRKLELALALASDPDLLLLDEPTAGVGSDESEDLQKLITDIASDRTVLLTEHDIDMIMSISDHITVLQNGQVISEGDPDEIANDPAVQEAYLGGIA